VLEDRQRPAVLSRHEFGELLSVARLAAEAGVRTALYWSRRRNQLTVEEKLGPADLVSQADRETEQAIRGVLQERRPDDGWWGEESGHAPGSSGIRWVVDPIDGTTEYLYDRPGWAVSVAAVREDDDRVLTGVVAEPAMRRTTEACLGHGTWSDGRRSRCRSSTDLARALVEEAGGITGDLAGGDTGGRWPAHGDILAANAGLWKQLQARLVNAY